MARLAVEQLPLYLIRGLGDRMGLLAVPALLQVSGKPTPSSHPEWKSVS